MMKTKVFFAKIAGFALAGVLLFITCDDGNNPAAHNHEWGNWIVTTAATCSTEGEETRVCALNLLHTEKRAVVIDPTAHDWQLSPSAIAPTCTEDGNGDQICAHNATHTQSGAIPKLGHDYQNYAQTTAPTCEADGVETGTCTRDQTTTTRAIAALGHNYQWGVTTAATCEAAGAETGTCTHDATHTATRSIAALGHNYGGWTVTTAATCETAGAETGTCTRDATHTTTRTGAAALGHDYEWVVTTSPTTAMEGVETEICKHDLLHTNGTRSIPKIFTSVTELSAYLSDIPNNTTATPYTVALNVNDLIGVASAIIDSEKYVSLDLSGSNLTSIANEAFFKCYRLISIIIPESVIDIGGWAFANCTFLTSVNIPNGVTSIGNCAFGETMISSVIIPSAVTSIGDQAFSSFYLTVITVVPENIAYTSDDGILYDKNKNNLMQCPGGKTGIISIPNSVTSIINGAFGSGRLTSVIIPASVTSIEFDAFINCFSLTSVTFEGPIAAGNFSDGGRTFPGDLRDKFYAIDSINGTTGTYTTENPGLNPTWTKQ